MMVNRILQLTTPRIFRWRLCGSSLTKPTTQGCHLRVQARLSTPTSALISVQTYNQPRYSTKAYGKPYWPKISILY